MSAGRSRLCSGTDPAGNWLSISGAMIGTVTIPTTSSTALSMFDGEEPLEGWTSLARAFLDNFDHDVRPRLSRICAVARRTTSDKRLGLACDDVKVLTLEDSTLANERTGVNNLAFQDRVDGRS